MSSITRRSKAHNTYTTEEIYNNSYLQEKEENQGEIEDGDKVADTIRIPNGITKKNKKKKISKINLRLKVPFLIQGKKQQDQI